MLRLCYIANANTVHSHRWIAYFAGEGHEVDWISVSPCTAAPPPNVRLHLVGPPAASARSPLALASAAWRIRSLVRRIDPDLIHAHYAGVNGILAAQAGVRPFVVTAWGSDVLFAGRKSLQGLPIRAALRSADRVTCDAEHMRREIAAMGVAADRLDVIYFGTDTAMFSPDARDERLAADLGVQGRPTVISLRNFHPVYDIATFIRAIPLVRQRVPDALFLLGGSGPDEAALRELATRLGVIDAVRFLGALPASALPAYLRLADVYVSTSRSDAGLSASTAEAMACGVPVVVTDSGDNTRWITDGLNGFIVPVGAPDALALRIVTLLDDSTLCQACGHANRDAIVERNSYRTEMAKVEELYYGLVPAARTRRH
jgi:glycosyltransferase involved in cell wall biosynthesis